MITKRGVATVSIRTTESEARLKAGQEESKSGWDAEALQREKQQCPAQAKKICPRCLTGILDYDGMLDLVCPTCSYQISFGGFT
jgi:hypothetical protein